MIGQVFTRLTVIGKSNKKGFGVYWVCKCSCGNIKEVRAYHLKGNKIKSCGCHKTAIATTHGYTKGATHGKRMPEYNVWASMIRRCENPNNQKYNIYGGRGINVCERWHRFENFISDMGLRPSNKHSLDRFPNKNGNYEPSNCRWATIDEQNRNLNSNIWIEHNGRKQILTDWAKELGIDSSSMRRRIKKGVPFAKIYNKYAV